MGKVNVLRSSGLVLDWDGRTTDRSRNHHTLTNHNAVPVRGKYGKGMYFNGSDAYIDCGNDASLDITDAITIEAWVKNGNLTSMLTLLSKGTSGSKKGYVLTELSTEQLRLALGNTSIFTTCTSFNSIPLSVWTHIALTYNNSTGEIIFYFNGLGETPQIGITGITPDTKNFEIAAHFATENFNGSIDSVRIYNRALSAAEILAHYKSKGYLSGLVESPVKIV